MPDFDQLFEKFLNKTCTEQEKNQLYEMISGVEYDPLLRLKIDEVANRIVEEVELSAEKSENLLSLILTTPKSVEKKPGKIFHFSKWWAAAAILLIIASGSYFFWKSNAPAVQQVMLDDPKTDDVAPGTTGATLTLADGTTVILDSLGNGIIAQQNGSNVSLNNGLLAYEQTSSASPASVSYNSLSTPKGRQFHIVLPDGTQVWLNAASSLRYPTSFSGNERLVEFTGEAYFEVAKNASKPFRVNLNKETVIEVLGTSFNVNSYANEELINTTLIEGSVQVKAGKANARIKVGQQAQVVANAAESAPIKVVSNANLEKVLAWKNGVFDFQDASLEEVMRQLERWYDIEVEYTQGIPKLEFFGRMQRNLTLSNVLAGLKMSKVNFKIEKGRKLIVLP